MRMNSRALGRPLVACMVAGAMSLSVAACGTSSKTSSSSAGKSSSASSASSTSLYGALPASGGTPTTGGTLTVGFTTGATPLYIMPIYPAADASAYGISQFDNEMFPPLYNGPNGKIQEIDPAVSIADLPIYSDGDKTVTIKIKPGYTWTNGAPVDANDVVFDVDLTKAAVKLSAANVAAFSPGLYPSNVRSISATSKYTVVMHLTKGYNPGFFLNDQLTSVNPIPSTDWNIDKAGGPHLSFTSLANDEKIYTYLNKLSGSIATFGTNPLWKDSDGPFVMKSFNTTNSSFVLDANPKFGGQKPHIAAYAGVTYTGTTPEVDALKSGTLDIGTLDTTQLGVVPSLKSAGYSVFGYPDLGWTGAFINFKDTSDHFGDVAKQLYFRQALAHLEDQSAYVKGIFKGAAGAAYGPVPSVPVTAFTPTDAVQTDYPFSTSAAESLLKDHGWKIVPNGTDTCMKAGSGAGECGAGIPAGTPLKFEWAYLDPSVQAFQSLESEAIASEAKTIGIDIQLESKAFNFMVASFDDANPASAKYDSQWGVSYFGGYTDDFYPTQNSIFNTGGSYNQGDYSSPEADKLISASVNGANAKDVTAEASYLTANIPALFFPNPDLVYAVSNKVGGPADPFLDLTQYDVFAQYLWIKK
jgi:peptide/nickel transport system substrate-binding protein